MLIKEKDKLQEQIDYLTDLMERDIDEDKKRLIERELKFIHSGKKGEDSSAYYLDFDFKKSKNWAVIHDLRIEHDGNVAQIDHLLIGRLMDIYVIESKNYTSGVSISEEGDFSYFYNNKPFSIESPIAQNERHIKLLKSYLKHNDLLPKRLGIKLMPKYRNIVLISPKSRLTKPKKGLYDCSSVMKADKFSEKFESDLKDDQKLSAATNIAKIISSKSLEEFANKLALVHSPIEIDYKAKFGLIEKKQTVKLKQTISNGKNCCPKCGKDMIKRESKKGKKIGEEFLGCSDFPKCRGTIKIDLDKAVQEPKKMASPSCPKCDEKMIKRTTKKGDKKGIAFWGCSTFPKCRGTITID